VSRIRRDRLDAGQVERLAVEDVVGQLIVEQID
jgi:hypothetical protein